MVSDSFSKVFEGVSKVLVVMPHPDDTELYCGGTVARLVSQGIEVRVIKMTYGEMGCRQENITPAELKKIREREDKEGMEILGIKSENNIYLNLGDGKVKSDTDTIGLIAKEIRIFQPDLIITTNSEDMIIRFNKDVNWFNHPDHINTSKATIYGSYPYARDISFFPEYFKDSKAKSHICNKFLFADYFNNIDNVLIDVMDYITNRVNAHACHSSQYSKEDAEASADFYTLNPKYPKGKRFEEFRYVVVD